MFIQLSFNWSEIDCFKSSIEQTINTTSLRFRYQIISVIKQIQVNIVYFLTKF